MLFWVTQATSWNILSGYSGYFSFGQAAYVGIGAYTTAVLYGRHGVNFYLTVAGRGRRCAPCWRSPIGALAFRLRSLRGEIFALLTLAVPFILAALARTNDASTAGRASSSRCRRIPAGIGLFQDFLYLLNLLVAGRAVGVGVRHPALPVRLGAGGDPRRRGRGRGRSAWRRSATSCWRCVASAVIGGVGGSVFALQIGFVAVDSVFSLTVPLFVIVMSVLGGRTHWLGPVLGAVADRAAPGPADRRPGWRRGGSSCSARSSLLVVIAPEGLYARVRARPRAALVAFAVTTAALWRGRVWGEPLDWLLVGMLAAAVVAIWPPPAPGRPAAPLQTDRIGPGRRSRADEAVRADERKASPGAVRAERAEQAGARRRSAERQARPEPRAAAPGVAARRVRRRGRATSAACGRWRTSACRSARASCRPGRAERLGQDHAGQPALRHAAADPRRDPDRRAGHRAGCRRTGSRMSGSRARTRFPRPFASMTVRDNVAMAIMFGRSARGAGGGPPGRRGARWVSSGSGTSPARTPRRSTCTSDSYWRSPERSRPSPKVLLLDEALAGLNPAEIDSAVGVVRRIHRSGISIVIVEHLLRVVNQFATRIVVLDRGTLLADGDPRR